MLILNDFNKIVLIVFTFKLCYFSPALSIESLMFLFFLITASCVNSYKQNSGNS